MQKTPTLLVLIITGLFSFNFAYAQSSHDAVYGTDTDFMGNTSKFEIGSPDGNFKMGFKGHLQHDNRFTYDKDSAGDKFNFKTFIRRARFKVYGNAFDPALTYFFQIQAETGTDMLRDYYVNLAIDSEYFHLRFGKFRTPFSRQQLVSTSQMQFVKQTAANDMFQHGTNGRGVGLMLHNGFKNGLEWALAIVSDGLVARLGYNYGGIDGYEFTDFRGGDFRFAIAANASAKYDYKSRNFQDDIHVGGDLIMKVEGFSTNGEFYWKREREAGDNFSTAMGGGLDLGYLIAGQFEPVLRYSMIKPKEDVAHQIQGGLNYYAYGHHFKVQVYGGTVLTTGANPMKIGAFQGGIQLQFAL